MGSRGSRNMDEANFSLNEAEDLPIEFAGSGWEFFKIWIVNQILSILTLGIYSAWAKVRTNRYFYGNTRLGGSGFEYHAKPITILKGRLIAVGLLLIYVILGNALPMVNVVFTIALFLALPWIIWRSVNFNARMTSYRNVRFAFDGPLKEVYLYLLLIPLLPLFIAAGIGAVAWLVFESIDTSLIITLVMIAFLVFYLLIPYIQKSIAAYTINNYFYGQGELSANLSVGKYYMTYLAVIAWTLGFFVLFGVLVGLAMGFSSIGMESVSDLSKGDMSSSNDVFLFGALPLMYLGMILLGFWLKAYVHTKLRNHVFSQIRLDSVLQLRSNMTVNRLFGLYVTNFLLLVITLGLAYPWVKVRIARFTADASKAMVHGSVDQYVTQQQSRQSALGEELGEAFDADAAVDISF
jgi:uncharacterized membrane protein YjgN (DUF898 family)